MQRRDNSLRKLSFSGLFGRQKDCGMSVLGLCLEEKAAR
jgi:hypothetical protein